MSAILLPAATLLHNLPDVEAAGRRGRTHRAADMIGHGLRAVRGNSSFSVHGRIIERRRQGRREACEASMSNLKNWIFLSAVVLTGCSSPSAASLAECERRFTNFVSAEQYSSISYILLPADGLSQSAPASEADLPADGAHQGLGSAVASLVWGEMPVQKEFGIAGPVADPVKSGCRLEDRDFRLSRITMSNGSSRVVVDVERLP